MSDDSRKLAPDEVDAILADMIRQLRSLGFSDEVIAQKINNSFRIVLGHNLKLRIVKGEPS